MAGFLPPPSPLSILLPSSISLLLSRCLYCRKSPSPTVTSFPSSFFLLLSLQGAEGCQSVSLNAHTCTYKTHTHTPPQGMLDISLSCCGTDLLTKVRGRPSIFHHSAHSSERVKFWLSGNAPWTYGLPVWVRSSSLLGVRLGLFLMQKCFF